MLVTSEAQAARRDPDVRAAMKKGQLARLAAKGKPGYGEMFANQPAQVAKRKVQQAERQAERAIKTALQAAIVTEAGDTVTAFEGGDDLQTKPGKRSK